MCCPPQQVSGLKDSSLIRRWPNDMRTIGMGVDRPMNIGIFDRSVVFHRPKKTSGLFSQRLEQYRLWWQPYGSRYYSRSQRIWMDIIWILYTPCAKRLAFSNQILTHSLAATIYTTQNSVYTAKMFILHLWNEPHMPVCVCLTVIVNSTSLSIRLHLKVYQIHQLLHQAFM